MVYVMKNCDLFVSGPEFAMARMPRLLNCECMTACQTVRWEKTVRDWADGQVTAAPAQPSRPERCICPEQGRHVHCDMVCRDGCSGGMLRDACRARHTLSVERISSGNGLPHMLWPPLPEPEGSPVWIMKPLMFRCHRQLS